MQEKNKENIRIIAVMPGLGLEKLLTMRSTVYKTISGNKSYEHFYRFKDLRNVCYKLLGDIMSLDNMYNIVTKVTEQDNLKPVNLDFYLQRKLEEVISNSRVLDECINKTPNMLEIMKNTEDKNFLRQVIVIPCNNIFIEAVQQIGYDVHVVIPELLEKNDLIAWFDNLKRENGSNEMAMLIFESFIKYRSETKEDDDNHYEVHNLIPKYFIDIDYVANAIFGDIEK